MENRFFGEDGRLKVIPKKNKFKIEIFKVIIDKFEEGVTYSETEVNQILKSFYHDYAILRRYLVDYGFLSRDSYGSEYIKKSNIKNEC
ncbi:hypothetical protein DOK67_0001988 [Enterococcus sp. DIV0212c]|uniref:DUF2087 domain-containing protein n=1 Tax=Candidatus Enterococcus ikei TaxID=2815326 RepID=A0ABS3GZJ1_9ENTE|nr:MULTISPECIES: DUF2087 domain-containing protein [unclassified Enterococcus]MBO0440673.1 DUF2087 domain-containing protein [Enterococcus sp. DIV0869a]MBO1355370.1 DUF2087 domain-containing protein [Enterococcus sp. DIV0212c]